MKAALYFLLFIPFWAFSQQYKLQPLNSGTNTSIRGLSVVSNQVAWVSGSNGYVGKTTDGGISWKWIKPAGYEKLDFRDIEAFDNQKAIVINAGSPAFILLTVDGGKTWKETYKNIDSAIFLDGMDFWDKKNGIIFGDPIHHKLQLLKTRNGGLTWVDVSEHLKMEMETGEAGFAASGTTIKAIGNGKVWITTGGAVAYVYHSNNYGDTWNKYPCPILQGENNTGPFSMDFYNDKKGIIVGGNYQKDKENLNNVLLSNNGGKDWIKPISPVFGYRSGVTYLTKDLIIAVGTSGVDLSRDGGLNWVHLSDLSFNAVRKKGALILLAGNKGVIYSLKLSSLSLPVK